MFKLPSCDLLNIWKVSAPESLKNIKSLGLKYIKIDNLHKIQSMAAQERTFSEVIIKHWGKSELVQ